MVDVAVCEDEVLRRPFEALLHRGSEIGCDIGHQPGVDEDEPVIERDARQIRTAGILGHDHRW